MPPHLPIKGFSTFIAFNSCARRALGIQNRPFRVYQSRCLHLKPLSIPSIRLGDKVCYWSLIYKAFVHGFKASAPRNCPLCCFAQKSLRCFGSQAGCNTRWNQENLLRSPSIFSLVFELHSESQSLRGNTTPTRTQIRVQEINSWRYRTHMTYVCYLFFPWWKLFEPWCRPWKTRKRGLLSTNMVLLLRIPISIPMRSPVQEDLVDSGALADSQDLVVHLMVVDNLVEISLNNCLGHLLAVEGRDPNSPFGATTSRWLCQSVFLKLAKGRRKLWQLHQLPIVNLVLGQG